MYNLPEKFLQRMKGELGDEFADFLQSYNRSYEKSIRVNTLRISRDEFIKISPFKLEPIEWEPNGFYVSEEKPGKHIYHNVGLYYVQEASAMSAVPQLGNVKGLTVLDMCSAPGGKGTQIAQNMQGEGLLFLNDPVFSRAKLLSSNVERMGVKNAVVTSEYPQKIAQNYPGFFDKILVDAPCSGEGMFKTKSEAVPNWSEEEVLGCAERQKQILFCADKALKTGGTLVYSTCTYAREEDEEQIAIFLSEHKNYSLVSQQKLYPHKVRGCGHFVAELRKNYGDENGEFLLIKTGLKDKKLLAEYENFQKSTLKTQFQNLYLVGDNLYSLPQNCPKFSLRVLRAGVHLGEFVKGRFTPSHSLAMSLNQCEVNSVAVNEKTATDYLCGLTFPCNENLKGYFAVTYNGFSLGWCKCVNGIAKNHLPKGLRINN